MNLYADNQAKADFPAALAAAKSVLDNKDNMLAGEIDAAVDQLVSVLEQLRFKADKSILASPVSYTHLNVSNKENHFVERQKPWICTKRSGHHQRCQDGKRGD